MIAETTNQSQRKNNPEINLISDIIRRYFPFWPVFILVTGITLGVSFIYLKYQSSVYVISAEILLKDPKKGVEDSKLLEGLNPGDEKKIIENETIIISSWPLMREVVNRLNLYSSQFKKGQYIDQELYGENAPLSIFAINKDGINSVATPVNILIQWQKGTFVLNSSSHKLGDTITINKAKFVISANAASSSFREKNRPDERIILKIKNVFQLASQYSKSIIIEPTSKAATILSVSIPVETTEKGIDIINTIFSVYNEVSQSDKNRVAQRTLDFVNDRLSHITKDLEKVEDNVKDYKTSAGIIDIGEQGKMFLSVVQSTDMKLNDLNEQLSVLKDVESYVNGKGAKNGTVPSLMGIPDGTLASLLSKLYETEIELERLSKVTGTHNDQLDQLRGVISSLKPDILENIRNIRKNFNTSKDNLELKIAESNKVLKQIPAKEKTLIEISRQQNIKNSIYSFLLQKREETILSYASEIPDIKVIAPAQASQAVVKSVATVVYLSALSGGICMAALLIFLLETSSSKVLFRSEIEEKISSPIVGELMFDTSKTPALLVKGKRDLLSEQFRTVRANLAYLGSNGNGKCKVIQICSSTSGEGKSYVSSNLAIAFSLTGKKVVLMDLDLRRPKINLLFNLDKEVGASDFLMGNNSLNEILKEVPEYHNLKIITSGTLFNSPSELIDSDAFKELMKQITESFDLVIFDTPPVSLVSDSLLLSSYSDIALFVIRHNMTRKIYLNFIQQLEHEKRFNNMGILFNGLKPRGFLKGTGSGYGNGLGYGLGYGYEYKHGYSDYIDSQIK